MRWFSLSDKEKSQLKKDYLKWLVDNHKKFTLIDDTYFVCKESMSTNDWNGIYKVIEMYR